MNQNYVLFNSVNCTNVKPRNSTLCALKYRYDLMTVRSEVNLMTCDSLQWCENMTKVYTAHTEKSKYTLGMVCVYTSLRVGKCDWSNTYDSPATKRGFRNRYIRTKQMSSGTKRYISRRCRKQVEWDNNMECFCMASVEHSMRRIARSSWHMSHSLLTRNRKMFF